MSNKKPTEQIIDMLSELGSAEGTEPARVRAPREVGGSRGSAPKGATSGGCNHAAASILLKVLDKVDHIPNEVLIKIVDVYYAVEMKKVNKKDE